MISGLALGLAAVSVAQEFLGLEELGGDNVGPGVEYFQRSANIPPGSPWCAAFVNGAAEIACAIKNVESPLEDVPLQGYVQSYYNHGTVAGWRREWDQAHPGDLFLTWSDSQRRWTHIGFIWRVARNRREFLSLEGNTNLDGSSRGYMVIAQWRSADERTVSFLHWTGEAT